MFKLSVVAFVALFAVALAAPEPKAKPYFTTGPDAPVFSPYSGLPAPGPAHLPGPLPAGLPYGLRTGLPVGEPARFPSAFQHHQAGFPGALQGPMPNFHRDVVPAPFPPSVRVVPGDRPQFAAPFHHRSVHPGFQQAVHHF